ncbi:MAG: SDR family oxidoreductase [Betaproteobacteria bacterium]|nr:SDR family oxidoreductase [Betaproteobacteria bacterium]
MAQAGSAELSAPLEVESIPFTLIGVAMPVLDQKVAIVTGAGRGIGKAIALAYAQAGAIVVLVARTAGAIDAVVAAIAASGGKALAIAADVARDADIARIVSATLERFGGIDILVNNAAIIPASRNLVDSDPRVWREVIDVNLIAPAMLIKAVLPGMIARRSGKIINISSIGGRNGGRGRSAYRASKAGLINLTQSVAAEVKSHGIDVNCICPGGVDTEGLWEAMGPELKNRRESLMNPKEIAEVALFLASQASSSITGTSIDAFGLSNPIFRSMP